MIMPHLHIVMPTPPTRESRRAAILEAIQSRTVRSQGELAELLARRGLAANQGTLSRDLRDLGVVKGADGYALAGNGAAGRDPGARLLSALRQYFQSAVAAQNQVVLKTPPGGAQPLALALDAAGPEGILGTLAGDDTILLVTPDAAAARSVASWLEEHA